MEMTIQYKSSRSEIARWYWRMWKRRLWKTHLTIFFAFLIFSFSIEGHWPIQDLFFLQHAIMMSVCLIIFFILFPQVKFKPQLRSLTVSEDGIKTVIGSKSGAVSWTEIIRIEDNSEYISIIRKTLNAFVVPQRAFLSDEDRSIFLDKIRAWQQKAVN